MAVPQRRQSLLFDVYQQAHFSFEDYKAKDEGKLNIPSNPEQLSIDDLDMMPLSTSFDKQMLLGSPMYLDPEEQEEKQSMVMEEFSHHGTHSSRPVPSDASNLHLDEYFEGDDPFENAGQLRAKYLLASSQDCASNIKYDMDRMFLYPKPLPKFWKFAKDERLNDESTASDYEYTESEIRPGCYFPTLSEDQYVEEEQLGVPKRLGKVHYTGEFFEMSHFQEEFEAHKQQYGKRSETHGSCEVPTFEEFRKDFLSLVQTVQCSPLSEIAQRRIHYLLEKFELFQHLNAKSEILENKRVPLRDFYNSRKVDRDVLLSGCATQRQLSEFIWEKLNVEPHRIVHRTFDGKELTLSQIFEKENSSEDPMAIGLKVIDDEFLEWYKNDYLITLNLIPSKDAEKTLAGKELYFYLLAKIFLDFDNYLDGEYLAEIFIKYCVHTLEKSKYQLAQISVDFKFYENGEKSWWNRFSHWIAKWRLVSHNIRWNVRISRAYSKLFKRDRVKNFQDFLDLLFGPLFIEENQKDVELQFFLMNVCCLDLVVSSTDDYLWQEFADPSTDPKNWMAKGDNPTISHYMYHIYAHLAKLNFLRQDSSLNTICLRNYCSTLSNRTSQAGSEQNFTDQVEALICNFLLCDAGLLQAEYMWDSSPLIAYLYYLCQIPVVVAPLSSVSLFSSQYTHRENSGVFGDTVMQASRDITEGEEHTYRTSPFMDMFKIGMKVSLSSKSVLFNSSYTMEPLIEEYSVAASIYLLNAADLCEFSRTSVLCSGFEGFYKAHWIGVGLKKTPFLKCNMGYVDEWYDREPDTSARHNVPLIRRFYRKHTWDQEWDFIRDQFD